MIEPHDAVAAAAPRKAKVITFPPSLDCELSRFLLGHYGVPFEEQRHTVLFSFFHTLLHGATLYFPLLYGDGRSSTRRWAAQRRPSPISTSCRTARS
jgi:hypothetical protein